MENGQPPAPDPSWRGAVVLLSWSVLGALGLLAAWQAPQAAPPSRSERAFLEWVEEHSLRLEALDGGPREREALAALDPLLEGVRLVLLGEPDHFVHEKNDVRALLIRHLFERGFRHVGMEMGRSDALRMDRFVESGDPAHLERVALYGYEGDRRTDREDGVEGFTEEGDPRLERAASAESRWLLGQLAALNAGRADGEPRVTWFGYDVSFAPGGGYADVAELLQPWSEAPLVQELLARLARVQGESRPAEVERLEALLAHAQERDADLERLVGAAVAREVSRSVRNLADSLAWIEASEAERFGPAWLEGLAARERCMMRNVDERLAELGPETRVVLLGHDLHLSKDSTSLTFGPAKMWPSLGTHLAERYPGQVLAIWMLYDHGRHADPRADPVFEDVPSQPGSLESLLAQVGERFLLPLRGADGEPPAYLRRGRRMLRGLRVVLPDQADAVVFLRTVSEPRER